MEQNTKQKVILFARNRFKGYGNPETIKRKLAGKDLEPKIKEYELDHIIPYCISEDSSLPNLQLLHYKDHLIKSIKDKKIIRQLKKEGYIESVFAGQMYLLKPQEEVIARYIQLNKNQSNERRYKDNYGKNIRRS